MRHRRHHRLHRRQRGAAALVVTMLLVFAMLIVVAVANRNAIVETRASANQYRSTQRSRRPRPVSNGRWPG